MPARLRLIACSLCLFAAAVVLPRLAAADLPPFVTSWSIKPGPSASAGPYAITLDNAGYLYIVDNTNARIQKYTDSGAFVMMWGSAGSGDGQFNNLQGAAADGLGHIYALDGWNRRVQKFTDVGGYIMQWGSLGGGPGQFNDPRGIAVNAAGDRIYVTDVALCRVQEFDSTGTYITQWGSYGTDPGQFSGAWGIAVSAGGDVYVADAGSSCRIEKFTSAGAYVAKWDTCGNGNYDTQDCGITALAVGPDNNVFAASPGCNMIKNFTPTGGLLFRSTNTLASVNCEPNLFSTPYGVAVDRLGNYYVCSTGNYCVHKYGPGGSLPAVHRSWGQLKMRYR